MTMYYLGIKLNKVLLALLSNPSPVSLRVPNLKFFGKFDKFFQEKHLTEHAIRHHICLAVRCLPKTQQISASWALPLRFSTASRV